MKTIINYILPKIIAARDYLRKDRIKIGKVWDFHLAMPVDHALPRILKNRPEYSANMARLALIVQSKYPNLKIVDIGANIGDSVALLRSFGVHSEILCIEGDKLFFQILIKNLQVFSGVHAEQLLLSNETKVTLGRLERSIGSANFTNSVEESHLTTLDATLKGTTFNESKFVKIDTDGFDVRILEGAVDTLNDVHPVLFFELDRFLLSMSGSDSSSIFEKLSSYGYKKIVFFDNLGRYLLSTQLSQKEVIKDLILYTYKKAGLFPYYDVAVFHEEDTDIAETFISSERSKNESSL